MNLGNLQNAIVRMLAVPQDKAHAGSNTFQTTEYPWGQYWIYETAALSNS